MHIVFILKSDYLAGLRLRIFLAKSIVIAQINMKVAITLLSMFAYLCSSAHGQRKYCKCTISYQVNSNFITPTTHLLYIDA